MTTTNKAFIEAYNDRRTRGAVRPLYREELTEAFVAASEQASASASVGSKQEVADGHQSIEMPTVNTAVEMPRIDRATSGVRRPLSAVQAEELFGFAPTSAKHVSPLWPETCQQLLASAADRYDDVLRELPPSSNGTLIGIVGIAPRSGCTTTAICLAIRSSALGFSAALVDGDFTRGALSQVLQIDQFRSWGDLLDSRAPLTSAIQTTDDVGIDLLLTEPLPAACLEATTRFRASLVAGAMRRKYEQVVIDLGCAMQGQAPRIAALATAMGIDILLATATPETTSTDRQATAKSLDEHGLKIAGVIEAA